MTAQEIILSIACYGTLAGTFALQWVDIKSPWWLIAVLSIGILIYIAISSKS